MNNLPQPGLKRRTFIETGGPDGLPATFISGFTPGPTVLVVAGIHGGEYAAILALIEIARELEPSEIRGRLLMIHPANPGGFYERRATVLPEDGRNINSLFYDESYQGPAASVARAIAGLQAVSDFYLDLHTADLFEETAPLACYPVTGDEEVSRISRQAALRADVQALIKSTLPGAGITEAARRGLPGLLIKRGGPGGTWRRSEVELYKKDVINILKHLGLLEGPPSPPSAVPLEIEPLYLRSGRRGLWRPEVSVGQEVARGQTLGLISDFFGNTLETFVAEKDGLALYGLQALSANAGDLLLVY